MTFWGLTGPLAYLLLVFSLAGGVATLIGLIMTLTRGVKALRREWAEDRQRSVEIHEALWGTGQQLDDSGAVIRDGEAGLVAWRKEITDKLNSAAILNGKGERMAADVADIKAWTKVTDGRLDRLEGQR